MDEPPSGVAGFFVVGLGTLAAILYQVVMGLLAGRGDFVQTMMLVGLALFVVLPLAIGGVQLQRANENGYDAYRRGVIAGMIIFPLAPVAIALFALYEFTNGFRAF